MSDTTKLLLLEAAEFFAYYRCLNEPTQEELTARCDEMIDRMLSAATPSPEAAPQVQPVARIGQDGRPFMICRPGTEFPVGTPLYAAPPQPLDVQEQMDRAVASQASEALHSKAMRNADGNVQEWERQLNVALDELAALSQPKRDSTTERATSSEAKQLREALEAAQAWISSAPHGDNCFVSDHYEGDPGNRCNCGKESLESYLDSALSGTEENDHD
jgi:hypothetical protein